MSGNVYEDLKLLNKKLDELLMIFENLRKDYQNLKRADEELKNIIQKREERIKELEIKYERVKLSGALLGEGENAGEARKKINELVREIDRCVALINR